MDILTDIFNDLLLKGSVYFKAELTAPWGISIPAEHNVARFHIMVRGECWLRVDGRDDLLNMVNGDLVVIPHGGGHKYYNDPTTPTRLLSEVLAEIEYSGEGLVKYGGGGAGCSLVCGQFEFKTQGRHPLLENLPPFLHIRGGESYNKQWLDSAMEYIVQETTQQQVGAKAIINRLSEIIFIQVIRVYIASSKLHVPYISALFDPRISRALSRIHAYPHRKWKVEDLGREAGMSRSLFSRRFSELVEMTPGQYITLIRMQKAGRALESTKKPIVEIAESVGYRSEAAFSAAFKRLFGIRPGEFRRRHRGKENSDLDTGQ